MMRLLIDVNVFLDAFIRTNEPKFVAESKAAWELMDAIAEGVVVAVITPSGLATVIHYLQRNSSGIPPLRIRILIERVLKIMEWAPMHPEHFRAALDHSITDIEDAAQLISAQATGKIDAVVSRDKDFKVKGVKVLTAAQAVRSLK